MDPHCLELYARKQNITKGAELANTELLFVDDIHTGLDSYQPISL